MKLRCTWLRWATSGLFVAILILAPLSTTMADEKKVPERKEIDKKYLWATENIYPDDDAWEADFKALEAEIPKLAAYQGKLGESADTLLKFFKFRDDVSPRAEKTMVYAFLRGDEDTRDNKYQALQDRLRGLAVKFGEATAWVEPELTAIPWETLDKWMQANPDLNLYRHALENLFRQKKHILPAEQERLIALAGQVFSAPGTAYNLLANADLKFPTIKDADGNLVELSDSAFYIFMDSPDRRVRKDAYEGITGTYKSVRNTAAALLNGEVQGHIFNMRARGYESCLADALDGGNIPVGVYNNLIQAVNKNLPLLHRYTTLRRNALKLADGTHDYDLYARLTAEAKMEYTYEQAVDTMFKALAPLGDAYCAQVKKGVDSRWIDVYPTKGKQSGAYSSGTFLTQPYILLNFYGGYEDLSTLCHEMGHSMHSNLSRGSQPYVYADYDIFCAEVASTTNEILLENYILKQIEDPQIKLYLLGELLEGFRGTVFRQTMFSEFEQKIHEMAEQGIPLTADSMGAAYGEIMKKYYGPDYTHDELVNDYWIRIPHFYRNFYVYKYATSYCAASNIVARIMANEPGATDKYLKFLRSGSSKYPVELLADAGVDMTSPKYIEDAMKLFEGWLTETEKLLATQSGGQKVTAADKQ
ncbi:MAG TPA: oligoendopeptidase F [Phycisphaerae bacterium]|nr:oligoendopeptidase F [Phycisphaerae bacterium]HQL53551.1 oligoendopeptidase F [Phycisphaerae bacterium]